MNFIGKIKKIKGIVHNNHLEYLRIKNILMRDIRLDGNYIIFYLDKLYLLPKVRFIVFKLTNFRVGGPFNKTFFLVIKFTLINLVMYAKGLTIINQSNRIVVNRKIIIKRKSENLVLLDFQQNKVFYRYSNPKEKIYVHGIYKNFYKTPINQITFDYYLEADLLSNFDILDSSQEDYVIEHISKSQSEIFSLQSNEIEMKSLSDFDLSPVDYKYLESMLGLLKLNKELILNYRIPFAKQHGDFVYHNFYTDKDALGLLDFEYAGDFPVFYDLVHFVIYPCWLSSIEQTINQKDVFDVLNRFRKHLSVELINLLPNDKLMVFFTVVLRRILLSEINNTSFNDILKVDSEFLETLILN